MYQRTVLQMTYLQCEKWEVNVKKHNLDEKQLHGILRYLPTNPKQEHTVQYNDSYMSF